MANLLIEKILKSVDRPVGAEASAGFSATVQQIHSFENGPLRAKRNRSKGASPPASGLACAPD
jgi:hypothetical protein